MQPTLLPRFAVVFDLDDALVDSRRAWEYTVEEAVIAVTGRRVRAEALTAEYRRRPWRHALAVLLEPGEGLDRCAELCVEIFARSALKRLLVHEGIGMALDALRGDRVEMGAICRLPHAAAMRQIESTGLERFLTVLAPTPADQPWDPLQRFEECISYLAIDPARAVVVSPEPADLRLLDDAGVAIVEAGWAAAEPSGHPRLGHPGELHAMVVARTRRWA